MSDISRTARFSTAPWYNNTKPMRLMLIGLGGIGSHLAFQLSRLGKNKLYLYDDDSYESVNLAGQLVGASQVGQTKVEATKENIDILSPGNTVYTAVEKFTENTPVNKYMFSGLDNMEGRKLIYEKWKETYYGQEDAIYIDGRLSATEFQVLTLIGNNPSSFEQYEKEFLFDSSEAEPTVCTFKQTTYLAAMIAAQITGTFTNYLARKYSEDKELAEVLYNVPFFYSYNAESMIQTIKL